MTLLRPLGPTSTKRPARARAAAALIVHETGRRYPFNVVRTTATSGSTCRRPTRTWAARPSRAWISLDAATALLKWPPGLPEAQGPAATREFKPVPLGDGRSGEAAMRTGRVRNVAPNWRQRCGAQDEYVVYTAHWDPGRGHAVNGDAIYNGAADNAGACAAGPRDCAGC
jgi:hypothetical protein